MAPPTQAVVHPLVLLSVVDHYNRVAKDIPNKRVVGVLLGETFHGRVDVSNSFAVPFEEDPKDPSVWYLDHNFLENMFGMFRKVSAKEKIVGFYSTGPKIRTNDLDIDVLFRRYVANPLLVIIDIRPESQGIPTQAYYSVELVEKPKIQRGPLRTSHLKSALMRLRRLVLNIYSGILTIPLYRLWPLGYNTRWLG